MMSETLVGSLIAGLTGVLGGGALAALFQMIAARRKTGAEATKINTESSISEFDALKTELRLQRDEANARIDVLQQEIEDIRWRHRALWDYAAELRHRVPPPPPPWPEFLSLTRTRRSADSAN